MPDSMGTRILAYSRNPPARMRPILGNLWLGLLAASAFPSQGCERQGPPPCPRYAEALLQPDPAVAPGTVQQYLPGTDSRDFFDSRWAVSELLHYEEAPLGAAPGTKRAYRVQALGDFGWVIRLENDGAEAHFSFKDRHTCEDRYGLGAVRTGHHGSISIEAWRRIEECMSRSFWNARTHSQLPAEDAQTIIVEGIRGGRHHVI